MISREQESLRVARADAALLQMQRLRVIAAAVGSFAELGYGGVSVAAISERAGVSRRTFYELFENREQCVVAILRDLEARLEREIAVAGLSESAWRERVRGGLWLMLCLLDDEPALAQVCLVESQRGGPPVVQERVRILRRLAALVDAGSGKLAHAPAPLTAEAVVGAVVAILQARIGAGSKAPLKDLLGELMELIVLPYLGAAAARRERTRSAPSAPAVGVAGPWVGAQDPLAELPMRLTYRTARVLQSVAETPGTSNRLVSVAAGIQDQGQVSKLLARLERYGLLCNTAGEGQGKGEPNAWRLTARGEQLAYAIGARRRVSELVQPRSARSAHREGSCT
ncbi:MAG TPA: TetR/AcrR family transcriptional regulator [Solirubrobacteraceae bacterium]